MSPTSKAVLGFFGAVILFINGVIATVFIWRAIFHWAHLWP